MKVDVDVLPGLLLALLNDIVYIGSLQKSSVRLPLSSTSLQHRTESWKEKEEMETPDRLDLEQIKRSQHKPC